MTQFKPPQKIWWEESRNGSFKVSVKLNEAAIVWMLKKGGASLEFAGIHVDPNEKCLFLDMMTGKKFKAKPDSIFIFTDPFGGVPALQVFIGKPNDEPEYLDQHSAVGLPLSDRITLTPDEEALALQNYIHESDQDSDRVLALNNKGKSAGFESLRCKKCERVFLALQTTRTCDLAICPMGYNTE